MQDTTTSSPRSGRCPKLAAYAQDLSDAEGKNSIQIKHQLVLFYSPVAYLKQLVFWPLTACQQSGWKDWEGKLV